jgi:hypothetical protein
MGGVINVILVLRSMGNQIFANYFVVKYRDQRKTGIRKYITQDLHEIFTHIIVLNKLNTHRNIFRVGGIIQK